MMQTTEVPTVIYDKYLRALSGSELKVVMVILRWPDVALTHEEFMKKSGLPDKEVTKALAGLKEKGLVGVEGNAEDNGHKVSRSLYN